MYVGIIIDDNKLQYDVFCEFDAPQLCHFALSSVCHL